MLTLTFIIFGTTPPLSILKWSTFPFQFLFQNDQFSIIYQEILIFSLKDEWLQRKLISYVSFMNNCKKKSLYVNFGFFHFWDHPPSFSILK